MSTELQQLRAQLQHKKQTINQLDRLLYQQITTQNILNQLIPDDSNSQPSSRSHDNIESGISQCSSIASSQLLGEIENMNQFMMNCVRGKAWKRPIPQNIQTHNKKQQFQDYFQAKIESEFTNKIDENKQRKYLNAQQSRLYSQNVLLKKQQFLLKKTIDYSAKHRQYNLRLHDREHLIAREREFIRNELIQEQEQNQIKQHTRISAPHPIQKKHYCQHKFNIEVFKRQSTINRSVSKIRKAKKTAEKLNQTIKALRL